MQYILYAIYVYVYVNMAKGITHVSCQKIMKEIEYWEGFKITLHK
jgi:hypothetical protein